MKAASPCNRGVAGLARINEAQGSIVDESRRKRRVIDYALAIDSEDVSGRESVCRRAAMNRNELIDELRIPMEVIFDAPKVAIPLATVGGIQVRGRIPVGRCRIQQPGRILCV